MTIFNFAKRLKITHRLFGGFSIVVLLLVTAVGVTVWEVSNVKTRTDRIVNLRMPTAQASAQMTNNINESLAALRGFMLTGNKAFKIERAAVWADIAKTQAKLDTFSKHWTNPANIKKLQEFKKTLAEFKIAQAKVEKIARSKDEQPATVILVNDAAPRAKAILQSITKIIDAELKHAANDVNTSSERIAYLGYMADFRGSFAVGLANIRAFLLTGDKKFADNFAKLWDKNTKRFASIQKISGRLYPEQREALKVLSKARAEFADIPPKMFEIRGSKKWNMANYTLVTEAAPRADKLMTILNGPKNSKGARHAGMVANQLKLLKADSDAGAVATKKLLAFEWILLAIGVFVGAAVAFFTTRAIANPVVKMTQAMQHLAEGHLDTEVPAQDRQDEIGSMAAAVQVFKENAIRNTELVAEQEAQKQRAEEEKHKMMNDLADNFETGVGGIIDTVSAASAELESTAQSMSTIAEETSSQSAAVSAASEEAATNVQTVAAASEEMSHSISEINEQVNQASTAAKQAVKDVEETGAQMESLAKTADKIGEVIKMISDIAEQTNLLALNATIESARAGEAGKGFAVVASEVKELASQTGKATEQISEQVEEIQSATKQAVISIADIGNVIRKVDETSTAIAASMAEQGAATQEIARNVQEAATGTEEVTRNITGVSQASQEAGAASSQVMSAAGELSKQAELMKTEVNSFISQIRTG